MDKFHLNATLEERVESLELELSNLKNELTLSLKIIAELTGDDGVIAITMKQILDTLKNLDANISTTDDALGDANTLRSLSVTLKDIKQKLGVY
jgi:hypothetical protein